MFDNEIIIGKEDLKLRIQKGIMDHLADIRNTADIGFTSWEIADLIVEKIITDKNYKHKSNKKLDILDAKL